MAPQFTAMNGLSQRALHSCTARAASSLPVPDSPNTTTQSSVAPGAGDELKHLAHGRRIPDDVVEAAGLEALAELFVFPADAELVLLLFRNVVDEPFNGNERARGVERARGLLPHPFFLAPRCDDAVDEFPASVLLEGRCDGAADGFAVLFVGDVQEAEAFLAHEPVRRVPRQAKDAVADEADRAGRASGMPPMTVSR